MFQPPKGGHEAAVHGRTETAPGATDQFQKTDVTGEERWLPVVGYEGLYEVSDIGRVRRIVTRGGRPTERFLRPSPIGDGYPAVRLYRAGVGLLRMVHLVVADAFLRPRTPDEEVDHVDGVKAHNLLTNLEIVGPKENIRRAAALGLRRRCNRWGQVLPVPAALFLLALSAAGCYLATEETRCREMCAPGLVASFVASGAGCTPSPSRCTCAVLQPDGGPR